jgi:hypothetical protein
LIYVLMQYPPHIFSSPAFSFHAWTMIMNPFFLVGFEVFTAVVMKSIIFWDMTLYSRGTSGATQRTTRRHIPEDDTLHFFLASDASRPWRLPLYSRASFSFKCDL